MPSPSKENAHPLRRLMGYIIMLVPYNHAEPPNHGKLTEIKTLIMNISGIRKCLFKKTCFPGFLGNNFRDKCPQNYPLSRDSFNWGGGGIMPR